MNANKLARQSTYFQNGYDEGANGYSCKPAQYGYCQEGSYAWDEHEKGHTEGKADSGN